MKMMVLLPKKSVMFFYYTRYLPKTDFDDLKSFGAKVVHCFKYPTAAKEIIEKKREIPNYTRTQTIFSLKKYAPYVGC